MTEASLILIALYAIIICLMMVSKVIRYWALSSLLGFVLIIPIGYVLGPTIGLLEATPRHILTFALELSWFFAIAIVLGWFLDELRPLAAVRSLRRERSLPQRLRDQAPFLQAVPIVEDEDEPPALSPPRKNLPAPVRG